jgi:drug/metabolite transporter (DMT)-like permease
MQALLYAALAAFGNSLVALGQVKGGTGKNPFMFLTLALGICLTCVSTVSLLTESGSWIEFVRSSWRWFCLTGVGFFITFTGFYLLYSRCGASYYVLYAVMSILSTTLVVGVVILGEKFGAMRGAAVLSCLITVVLFSLGRPAPNLIRETQAVSTAALGKK